MWSRLSGIWKFLNNAEKDIFDSLWRSIYRVITYMRALGSSNGMYFEIPCEIKDSVKWQLDPTSPEDTSMITPISVFSPSEEYTTIDISERNFRQVMKFPADGYAVIGDKWTEIISIANNQVKIKGSFEIDKFSLTTGKTFRISPTISKISSLMYNTEEISGFAHIDGSVELKDARPDLVGVMHIVDYVELSTDLDKEYSGSELTPTKAEFISKAVGGVLSVNDALEIGHGNNIAESSGVFIGVFENFGYKIVSILGNSIVLDISNPAYENKLFGVGVRVFIGGRVHEIVSMNPITLDTKPSGDRCFVELIDNIPISKDSKVDVYTGGLSMLVDIIKIKTGGMLEVEIDGNVRHIESISGPDINLYEYDGRGTPKYGDVVKQILDNAKMHVKYPTPKIVVYEGGIIELDSTVDVAAKSYINTGDVVSSCVKVVDGVEVISFITGAEPGKFIPTFADNIEIIL